MTNFDVFDNTTGLMNVEGLTEDITVRFSYQNMSGEMENAVVFAAGYTEDGQKLDFVHKIFEGQIAFGEDGYRLCRIKDIGEEVNKIKLFLWNSYDGLVPLSGTIDLEKAN